MILSHSLTILGIFTIHKWLKKHELVLVGFIWFRKGLGGHGLIINGFGLIGNQGV